MMKTNILIFVCLALTIAFYSCTEKERYLPNKGSAPSPVTGVKVQNINGGAILTYKLPEDEGLLYVKAVYKLNSDDLVEQRSSLYSDTLKLRGFGSTDEKEVKLYAVDRYDNMSVPVTAIIKPQTPPVRLIGQSLQLISDFGGVHAYWDNPTRENVVVIVEKKDNNKEWAQLDAYYSSAKKGDVATRGLDTLEVDFRYYVKDRWGNKSEIKEKAIKPLFEKNIDRLKFRAVYLSNDEPTAWGWTLPMMFDGDKNTGFHTANGTGHWPQMVTIDLGAPVKISRIKTWQRQANSTGWYYRHGNPRLFELYGRTDLEGDNFENISSWTLMTKCTSIKPSGLPLGQLSDEDIAWASAGEDFPVSPDKPKVRYIRLRVLQTWSDSDFFHLMEIEVYGNDK